MFSSIINLVIDNFLSNFVEIDKSQTYASLLSGELELKNVKIKKDCFGYINLPYFILEIGYIGKIKIEMSVPFFYSSPINIFINDIFIYAKQKDINKLKEKEEINSIKAFKNQRLETEENILNKLEEIESTEPSMITQIINNINITIKNLVIRFEDSISNSMNPFSLGIILKEFRINSLKENNNTDFNYKRISLNDLNIFMDSSNSFEDLNYDKLIDQSKKDMVPLELTNYLGEIFNFYVYCHTELNNDLAHEYILYKLSMDIKITINSNLDNNNPKYEFYSNEIENLILKFHLEQISNLFLLLSYYNLFYYFQLGLERRIFNKKLDDNEKENYMLEYMKYYYKKYKEKNIENNNDLKKIEDNMNYEEIKKLRKIALNNLYNLYIEEKEIEKKLKDENNKWFFSSDKNLIKELNEQLTNIKNKIKEKIKYHLFEKYLLLTEKENTKDIYWNLPDDFIFYVAKLTIKNLHLKISDYVNNNTKKDLLDFSLQNTTISYTAKKFNTSYSIIINNFVLSQNIVINSEYDKLIIAKSEKEEEFILIEYQTNKDYEGNYINKVIFKSGIQILLFVNLYELQYINHIILSCFYAFISFIEISKYSDDNINDYLQLGYIINENNKLLKKKIQQESYTVKYDYDINLRNPVIIIPQDILNSENRKCIIISSEEIIIKTNLSSETIQKDSMISQENLINESNSNYESCLNDSSIMDNIYDKHFLNINGIQVSLSNYCIKEENYKSVDNIVIDYFNLSILYKTLIDINDKNNNYNISSFTLDIKELNCSIDEFQIFFLLTYLKNIKLQNEYLIKNKIIDLENYDDIMKKCNDDQIKEYIEKLELKEILSQDEFILFNQTKNIKENNQKGITTEEEFYKRQNKFFMEIRLNKINFIISQIYPDLSKEIFLQLELNNLLFSKFNSCTDDTLMKIYLKDISLLNLEQNENKNFLLPIEFQLAIKNDEEKINCINYSSLYLKNGNEFKTNVEINNLNFLMSFDSLARIYQFAMYYFGKYQEIYYDNNNNNDIQNLNIRQSNVLTERSSRYSQKKSTTKHYKLANQNIFKVKLNNSFFRIPSDEKKTDKPIFSIKLNIFYDQSSNSEKEQIYDFDNKKILNEKLLFDNKNMNVMIYESDFDIIYYNEKCIRNNKIISNYRIQYNSKYSYLLSKKNSLSNMNIIVEPLILNINLYQLKYLIKLYSDLMKFLFESLYLPYIPYLKEENVIYVFGKPYVNKRKNNIKKIFIIAYTANKIKNELIDKPKRKKKEVIENITNSFNSINFRLDKIYVTILDDNYSNKKNEKRVLLALEMSKLLFNKINNSNPKDITNLENKSSEISNNSQVNIKDFVIQNLYNYMNCTFTLELYYYNLEFGDFEPIIEPFDMQYLSFQQNPKSRAQTQINIEKMININVSTNAMKILNIFMSKYPKEYPNGIDNDSLNGVNIITKKKSSDLFHLISKDSHHIEDQEEAVIKLTNKTGVFLYFWFDFDKENKIKIQNNETIPLTNKQIYKTRKRRKLIQKKESEKNTFSFKLLDYESIKQINLNCSDNLYFKTKIDENKYLLYNLKINTNSFIKEIIFESSMIILNETKFDELILSLDDISSEDHELILPKNQRVSIPLTWVISSKNIFLQYNKNSEKFLLYNNISEIFINESLSPIEIQEKQKQIEDIKKSLETKLNNYEKINLHHPKYKDYISTYILKRFNKKDSKSISIKNQNSDNISLYFDYCSIQYKFHQNSSDKLYHFLEYTKKSTEFIILIRPIANITNYTPYNIICQNNNDNLSININQNQTIEIYDDKWIKDEYLIKFNLSYNNENYESEYMNLHSKTNYINFSNENKTILRCNISHNILNKTFNIFEKKFETYSLHSYNYILFFDFIVNNRMHFDLYGIDPKDIKNNNANFLKFNSKSLSVFSSPNVDIQSLLVNSNESKFNKKMKVNLNVVDLENVIEVEYEKNMYSILYKASNSLNYKYSNILLFEPKYLIINDLDMDIYVQQINEDNKPIDDPKEIISKRTYPLYYKNHKKIIFKIGIYCPLISFTGAFELDNSMEYELKVEVDDSYKKKYPKNVFYMNNKLYLYFRIKNAITDEGVVYLLITFPDFPILEIDNRTKEEIRIYETKKKDEPILINPLSKIPFIWSNNVILKSKFICEILNKKYILSFSEYNKRTFKINENKIINIFIYQKNSLTGTRCITFEEINKLNKKNKEDELESNSNQNKLNSMNIFIKGVGLSFLDEIPKEIFYISFYEIRLQYTYSYIAALNKSVEIIEFHLKNFQIDSSLNNTIKTLIYPKKQNIPSLESENLKEGENIDFFVLSIEKKNSNDFARDIKSVEYPKIDLCIQEMNIKIEQAIIMNLVNLIKGYTSKLDYLNSSNLIFEKDKFEVEEKLLIERKIPVEELKKEIKNTNKILINYLCLSAIKLNLSIRLELSSINISYMPKFISRIITSLGSSLVRISESPIKFKEKIIENIYMNISEIITTIYQSYIKESIFQIYKILGSSDLIGNPIQLIEKIGTGFFEFVNEPRKGLLEGSPSQIGKGLKNGITGLLNGVVGGAFDSVSKISGTLYNLVQNITGENKDIIIDDDNEPSDILEGASKGFLVGIQELYEGFTGFVVDPIEKVTSNSDYNVIKMFKDFGKGLFRFAVSPVNFVLRFGNSLSVGTKNTFNYFYNKNIKNQRFRFPRYIKQNSLLTIYEEDLSAAKEFLFKIYKIEDPNIIYFSQFICENKRYIEKIAFLIMTSEIIILLSNKYEVILKMNVVDITKVELKYNGKYFEFVCRLNEDKYKIILINKQNNLFACELYFILEKILFKERNYNMKNTIKKIPLIKRFKSGLKENIKKKKENEEEDISENA